MRPHNLKNHMKIVHLGKSKQEIRKELVCKYCNQVFNYPSTIEHHIKTVHEGIRVQCNFCVKTYTDKNSLKDHINAIHNNVKIFCNLCGSKFSRPGALKYHMRRFHEGGKPFIRKRQPNKSDTPKRTTIKPKAKFTCEFCGNNFDTKAHKIQHMKGVHRRTLN